MSAVNVQGMAHAAVLGGVWATAKQLPQRSGAQVLHENPWESMSIHDPTLI